MSKKDISPWGSYAPPKRSKLLRLFISAGLGRGTVRAKILKNWIKNYGSIVDVKVRGINYRLNLSDNVTDGKILASSVIYDKKELGFLRQACQGGVFVDVGANIGYYSLVLAQKAHCRVIAIEPNPTTLERLRFNVMSNRLLQDNIAIVPLGVGDNGEFELHLGENLGEASLYGNLITNASRSVTITTKPLLEILTEHKVARVDALKIDIEGMEDRALVPFFEAAPAEMWPGCIVLEDDHQLMWQTDLLKVLSGAGYSEVARTSGNTILQRRP